MTFIFSMARLASLVCAQLKLTCLENKIEHATPYTYLLYQASPLLGFSFCFCSPSPPSKLAWLMTSSPHRHRRREVDSAQFDTLFALSRVAPNSERHCYSNSMPLFQSRSPAQTAIMTIPSPAWYELQISIDCWSICFPVPSRIESIPPITRLFVAKGLTFNQYAGKILLVLRLASDVQSRDNSYRWYRYRYTAKWISLENIKWSFALIAP